MQIFLGDFVSLMNDTILDTPPTVVSGQITGVVLTDEKRLSRVYVAGLQEPFFMEDGWRFIDVEEHEDE
jgi:hypothetical protein